MARGGCLLEVHVDGFMYKVVPRKNIVIEVVRLLLLINNWITFFIY